MSDGAPGDHRPRFEPEQEVRFAVVMYGGVSLAIYINGVAQELFRLVRSTAPARQYAESEEKDLENRVYYADGELDGSERAYRQLGQMLSLSQTEPEGDPVRTRFVVDIISGTSAGGINGILLGLAVASQKDFRVSADLWRRVADIEQLLWEKESHQKLEPVPPRQPESLLNGYRLYLEARDAMAGMAEESPDDPWRPAFAEQLDLAVTATDLDGLPLPLRLREGKSIEERTHRKVFRFSYGTVDTTGEDHTDFKELDLMLGFATRATSSFPFAFEPVLLEDVRDVKRPGDDDRGLERFFSEHRDRGLVPDALAFADGGYLDNKPFSYATEALRSRRADVPVSRKLLYIEPHPTVEATRGPPATDRRGRERDRPDVVGNVAASFGLPRHETIREDVAAVAQRNVAVQRLRELGLHAERRLDRVDPLEPLRDAERPVSDDRDADDRLGRAGPAYAAYRTLRVRTVLDALATLGAELRRPRPSDHGPEGIRDIPREIREQLRAWIETEHESTHMKFLAAYDAAFQGRRLSFLHDRVNDLLRRQGRAARMVAVARILNKTGAPALPDPDRVLADPREPALPPETATTLAAQAGALRHLKLELNRAIDALRRAERAPRARKLEAVLEGEPLDLFRTLDEAAQDLPGEYDRYMRAVGSFLAAPLAAADAKIKAAIAGAHGLEPWIPELLDEYDDRFEAYDMVVLPLAYPELGETNPVDIVRISPLDAPGLELQDPEIRDPTLKLAGIRVGHFGGFLDESWRDNDLMWGRLDAAEVIINTLVDDPRRSALREQAQAAILRQELRGDLKDELVRRLGAPLERVGDAAVVAEFCAAFKKPGELPASKTDRLTSRSLGITGRLLADAAYGRRWPSLPLRGLGTVGPGVARVALPVTRGLAHVRRLPQRLKPRLRRGWPPIRFGGSD